MSISALRWSRQALQVHARDMTPTEKLLLRHLADVVDDSGEWSITREDLLWELGVGDSTLDRAIRGLGKLGLLRVEQRRGPGQRNLANRYCLPVDVPMSPEVPPSKRRNSPPSPPSERRSSTPDLRQNDPPYSSLTSPPSTSVPSELSCDDEPETTMTRAAHDPDQMGLDLGVPEPAPKERKVNGPQAVLEAYEAAYVTEHQRASLRPAGRTRAEAKRLLAAGEPLGRVVEAAECLARGGNVFHTLDEECRRLRAHAERTERAKSAAVAETYGGGDASLPSTWIYG